MSFCLIGPIIGVGEFGVIYKAEANGILRRNEKTQVAVKTCRNGADIQTLVSELKIMTHLGNHLNIINLLGACTQNINISMFNYMFCN